MSNTPLGWPCVIVLVGPPASGKSHWALRNGHGAVHVSQDDLIDAITPQGFDHTYRPVYAAAEDAVALTALQRGYCVIVDRTNRTSAHRRRWLDLAKEAGAPAVAVLMTTAFSVCRQRNSAREGPRRVTPERMERMFDCFEAPHAREGFTAIYTESVTLAEILQGMSSHRKEMVLHEHSYQAG